MAHGLGTILDAAERLRAREDIAFVLVGTGAERAKLESEARDRGLTNIRFVGAVSKQEVKDYWLLCDVALVLLRDLPLFQHVIPSKIFEAWGSARTVILAVRGESARIVEFAHGGMVIPPEDPVALAEAVVLMATAPEFRTALGIAGRELVESQYDRATLAARMLLTLSEAAGLRCTNHGETIEEET